MRYSILVVYFRLKYRNKAYRHMNQQIRLHNIVQNDYSLLQCILYIILFEMYTCREID